MEEAPDTEKVSKNELIGTRFLVYVFQGNFMNFNISAF